MNLGHGHRRAVLILWAWTALLSAFVLYPTYTGEGDAIVPIGILALALVLFSVLHPRVRPVPVGAPAERAEDPQVSVASDDVDGDPDR